MERERGQREREKLLINMLIIIMTFLSIKDTENNWSIFLQVVLFVFVFFVLEHTSESL